MTNTTSPPRILVVDPEHDIRSMFKTLLELEGYTADQAASLEEARANFETCLYALVLTDSFATSARDNLGPTHALRQLCQPTPVGLITGWQVDPTKARQAGLAFVLEKPVELEKLLHQIAYLLTPRFTPKEEQQAHLIRHVLQAFSAGEWANLRMLLTPTIRYHPLTRSPFTQERVIIGLEPYLLYAQLLHQRLPGFQIEQVAILPHHRGLMARYQTSWQGSDGKRRFFVSSALFRLDGERISQIGLAVPTQRLKVLLEEEQANA